MVQLVCNTSDLNSSWSFVQGVTISHFSLVIYVVAVTYSVLKALLFSVLDSLTRLNVYVKLFFFYICIVVSKHISHGFVFRFQQREIYPTQFQCDFITC